jgi:hypothetical protein
LNGLTWLLFDDKRLNAPEKAAFRALDLVSEKDEEYLVFQLHRILDKLSYFKGEKKKAIHRFKMALGIA